MVDEEFYFEESNPKKVLLTILLILFVFGIFVGGYYYYDKQNNVKLKTVTVELGGALSTDINDYIKSGKTDGYTLDLSSVYTDDDGILNSVGEYSYKLKKGNIVKKGKLFVKDTTPPIVEVQELTIGLNEEYDLSDFLTSCTDLSEVCNVSFKNDKYYDLSETEGTHEVTLIINDRYNNEVTKKTKLIVSKDYSLKDVKSTNDEVSAIYPLDESWDKTYTVKFDKAISEDDEGFDSKILELVNRDFNALYDEEIKEKTMLTIYNRYNLVIGFSMRLEFVSGKVKYVQADDLTVEKEE